MNIGLAISKNGVTIKLTAERLYHILENHDELAGQTFEILETITNPDFIVAGKYDELMAVKKVNHRYLVVVYKELNGDGFVITAFVTLKIYQIKKRKMVWKRS